jgi:hypothetical protein
MNDILSLNELFHSSTTTTVASTLWFNSDYTPPLNDEDLSTMMRKSVLSLTQQVLIGISCSIVILLSLLGNLLVVTVILRFKRLKNATNYILLSLAIADISVAIFVMIPATIQDVTLKWIFSDLFCKFYNGFDITCCTASILHLLLVAVDRYIAIFKPLTYRNTFRTSHVFAAVIFVWTLSSAMSFIPIFMGWNAESKTDNQNQIQEQISSSTSTTTSPPTSNLTTFNVRSELCSIEANVIYAIISSSLSFYIPFFLMGIVYLQIFIVAKRQAKAIAQIDMHTRNLSHDSSAQNLAINLQSSSSHNNLIVNCNDMRKNSNQNNINGGVANNNNNTNRNSSDLLNDRQMKRINKILNENGETRSIDEKTDKKSRFLKIISQLKTIERKRTKDTKAIKTLGIIMGMKFLLCYSFSIFY